MRAIWNKRKRPHFIFCSIHLVGVITIDYSCLQGFANQNNFFRFPNLKQSRLYSNFNYGVVKFNQLSASDTPRQCVFGYIVESSVLSIFLRSVAINTRREAISLSQLLPQMLCVRKVWVRTFPIFLVNRQSNLYSIGVKCNSSSFK